MVTFSSAGARGGLLRFPLPGPSAEGTPGSAAQKTRRGPSAIVRAAMTFEDVVREHQDSVYGAALRILGDRDAALDAANHYHYYRFATREAATRAAVYWLARSAKPVIALSLAGQHAPIITGYTGTIGPRLADGTVTGLVVEDPQRGDLDPLTAKHRPDKSRSAEFQTGKLIGIDEWYTDDWWFRDAYKGSIIFNSDAKLHDVDRRRAANLRHCHGRVPP